MIRKQQEETLCSKRSRLAPTKISQKDPLSSLKALRVKVMSMKKTCRKFGCVPNTTYMKKVHKHIKGKLSEHNLWTHFPKDPNCPICARCKKNRAQCRQKVHAAPDDLPVPKKFADAIN